MFGWTSGAIRVGQADAGVRAEEVTSGRAPQVDSPTRRLVSGEQKESSPTRRLGAMVGWTSGAIHVAPLGGTAKLTRGEPAVDPCQLSAAEWLPPKLSRSGSSFGSGKLRDALALGVEKAEAARRSLARKSSSASYDALH